MNKDNKINKDKIKFNAIKLYVPYYRTSLGQQNIKMNQIMKKTPTELHYPEKSALMKEVIFRNFWTFELGTQEGINVPIWIFVGFQQIDRQHNQNLNNDTFYRMPSTSCQCIIGTEKYPDNAIFLNYNDDNYCQGYAQSKEAFRALNKDDILQPYISLKMILDRLMMVIIFVMLYAVSVYDIKKFLKVLNQKM